MPTYRLDLAYDGSGFHGYAAQPDVRTVQGALEAALFRHTGPVETFVAGRTDKGVHAAGQVVSFAAEEIDQDHLIKSLNRQLAPEIAVFGIAEVAVDFNARFSATARRYVYGILNRTAPDPFLARTTWHHPERLVVADMALAAARFVGEHDFTAFCRKAEGRSAVRRVMHATWVRNGHGLVFDVDATSFCHQMVRSMVAVCVDVGRGRLRPKDVESIMEARDRSAGHGVAPPHGLTLRSVSYEPQ